MRTKCFPGSVNPEDGTMQMRSITFSKTFTAQIFVGQRVGYSEAIIPIEEAEKYLQDFCNTVGFCVTITPTKFIYKNVAASGEPISGWEPGFIVGIIQYPLYPVDESVLRARAETLANTLKDMYQQKKVTIVYSDETKTIN